ncbi:MAG TPA: DUF1579 domain-containing protein [Myxococcales bacterium]|jgi:uncharacterized protein DUF1579
MTSPRTAAVARFAIAAALALPVAAARAQDPGKAAQHQPSAAEQAMMEKYMKAATPGPEHQKLAKLAGKWKLQVTSWFAPGAPPQKSEGTAEFKSMLGGRYVTEEVHGSMGDQQPFEGRGLSGFDNVTRENFVVWVDSMSTGPMLMRGKCAVEAKKCALKGRAPDPVAGKEVPYSNTTTMTDDDHFTFALYGPGPGGKTFKMLEIAYTRQ